MSRNLKELLWYLAQESPRQALMIREIKKVAVNAFILKKHCYNSIPNAWFQGKGFSAIHKKLAQHEGTLSDFILELAMTYKILSPMPGQVPTSPLKRKRSWNGQSERASQQEGTHLGQREAEILCATVKLNKVRKFTDDPVLNRIRLDRSLNHCMVSDGTGARCMLCSSGLVGNYSSCFICKTCKVRLCIRPRDGHLRTCADRFHSIIDPRVLLDS